MKYFIVLALCLSAAFAEIPTSLHSRLAPIKDVHYSQHQQTVEDAKRVVKQKLGGNYISTDEGQQQQQLSLEEVDSYGVGIVGASGQHGASSSSTSSSSGSHSLDTQQVLEENPIYVNGGLGGGSSFNSEYGSSSTSTQSGGAGPIVIPVAGGSLGHESFSEQRVVNEGAPVFIAPTDSSSADVYSHQQQSVVRNQAAPVYISSPSGSESYSRHEESRIQSQAQPVYVAPVGGSESYSSRMEERRKVAQPAPVYVAPIGGSESFSRQEERRIQSRPGPMYITAPSGSESYTGLHEQRVQTKPVPIVQISQPSGMESYSHLREQRIQSQPSSIIVRPSSASESYTHQREERVNSRPTQMYYTAPIGGSESYTHSRIRTVQSQPQPVVLRPSGTSESYTHHSEKIIKSQPAPVYVAPATGSESYSQLRKFSSSSQASPLVVAPSYGINSRSSMMNSQLQTQPLITFPGESSFGMSQNLLSESQVSPSLAVIPTGGASEFSRYSHQSSRTQAQPTVVYSSPASSSFSSSLSSSSSNTGSSLIPIVTGGGASSSLIAENSLHGSNSLGGGLVLPRSGMSSFGSHSSQFGSLGGSRLHMSSSGLDQYMTESERLARLQAQDIGVGGFRIGSTQMNLGGSSNQDKLLSMNVSPRLGDSATGYRAKSWEKSSRWSSGTEYGSDGKPKNYNLLSTAEAEQHDINGKKAGFKAATTTVDDDGKLSTYSIHS